MKYLVDYTHSVMDTVYFQDRSDIPKPTQMDREDCFHSSTKEFVRIDHRAGPGCFADNYGGQACVECGAIVHEEKTN